MKVDYDTYGNQNFICPKCGLKGKGNELSHGDFSEVNFNGDLNCPKCYELVAFWQAHLSDTQ